MINLSNSNEFQVEVLSLILKDPIFAGRFLNLFAKDEDLKNTKFRIFSNEIINSLIKITNDIFQEDNGISQGVILNKIARDSSIKIEDKEKMEATLNKAFSLTVGSAKKYEKELLEEIKIVKTFEFFKRIGPSVQSSNPKDILDFSVKASKFIQELNKISISTDNEVDMSDLLRLIDLYASDAFTNIPSGIKEIDEELNGGGEYGGYGRGEVTIILSGVNDGKSLTLISFEANALAHGYVGAHINLEGKKLQPPMRLISNMTNIPYKRLTRFYKEAKVKTGVTIDKFFTKEEIDKILDAQKKVQNLRVFHEITNCEISNIEGVIREAHHQKKLDFVVIDYAMLITAAGPFGKREEMMAYIFRRLEILAAELQISIVTPMQVNRSGLLELRNDSKGGTKYPVYTMDNVADVKKAVDTAATVIGYSRTQEERRMSMGRYHIIKQREGKVGLQVGIKSNFECNSMFDGERYYVGMGDEEVKINTKDPMFKKFEVALQAVTDNYTETLVYIKRIIDLLEEDKKYDSDRINAEKGIIPSGVEMSLDEYLLEIQELKNGVSKELSELFDNVNSKDRAIKFLTENTLVKFKNPKNENEKEIKNVLENSTRLNVLELLGGADGYRKVS